MPLDLIIILDVSKGITNNHYKGHETFLSSIIRLAGKTKNKSIVFLAIGDSGKSIRIVNVLVKYIGYIDDQKVMARYYQAPDVFLHPSRGDNFPSTILEAPVCAVPVVATAVGGIVEQIFNDVNGYLVRRGHSNGMANFINKIISNRDVHNRLSGNCVNRINHRYTLE